jgi:hypothetical protein|tara:strand:+ start:1745 stop:1918 length:174 start_codon:yes stop_codon:yes gene_type:complete
MNTVKKWLIGLGILKKEYVYVPPKKPRIQSTVGSRPVNFNEIYENLKKHQENKLNNK